MNNTKNYSKCLFSYVFIIFKCKAAEKSSKNRNIFRRKYEYHEIDFSYLIMTSKVMLPEN